MPIIPDTKDPNESEYFEYEYFRLLSEAEAFTGAEKLRHKVSTMSRERAIIELQRFIENEMAMRDLTPHTIEDMKKRIDKAVEKDDFYGRL